MNGLDVVLDCLTAGFFALGLYRLLRYSLAVRAWQRHRQSYFLPLPPRTIWSGRALKRVMRSPRAAADLLIGPAETPAEEPLREKVVESYASFLWLFPGVLGLFVLSMLVAIVYNLALA